MILKGCIFYVILRLFVPFMMEESAAGMSKKNTKLLIVDDEPDICTAIQSYFGRRGFAVSTTGSGFEALSMIKASSPDIVLLDIALTDLSGVEVLKRLREHDQKTKVIIITGHMYPEGEIKKIVEIGVSGFENKPLVLNDVERLVCRAIGRKPTLKTSRRIKKAERRGDRSRKSIVHKLSNLLGIIRNKCENFTSNFEDGIYKDKSSDELVGMSVEVMKDIEETVDRAAKVVEQIKRCK